MIGDFHFIQRASTNRDSVAGRIYTEGKSATVAFEGPQMVWQCGPEQMEVLIARTRGRSGPVQVQWRFDEEPPFGTQEWLVSSDGGSVFAQPFQVPVLTRRAKEANHLRVSILDDGRETQEYEFSMVGLARAISLLNCDDASAADGGTDELTSGVEKAQAAIGAPSWARYVGDLETLTYTGVTCLETVKQILVRRRLFLKNMQEVEEHGFELVDPRKCGRCTCGS